MMMPCVVGATVVGAEAGARSGAGAVDAAAGPETARAARRAVADTSPAPWVACLNVNMMVLSGGGGCCCPTIVHRPRAPVCRARDTPGARRATPLGLHRRRAAAPPLGRARPVRPRAADLPA